MDLIATEVDSFHIRSQAFMKHYVDLLGRGHVNNYIHIIGDGHFTQFLHKYGNTI